MPRNNDNDSNNNNNEGFMDKVTRNVKNCCAATGLCCFKAKEQGHISLLESKMNNRKKKFGMDYIDLVQRHGSKEARKKCVEDCMRDIQNLQDEIDDHHGKIENKEEEVEAKKIRAPQDDDDNGGTNNSRGGQNNSRPTGGGGGGNGGGPSKQRPNNARSPNNNGRPGNSPPPPSGQRGGPSGRGPNNNNNNRKPRPGGPGPAGRNSNSPKKGHSSNDPKRPRNTTGPGRKKAAGNGPPPGSAAAATAAANRNKKDDNKNYDSSKWKVSELKYNGAHSYETVGKQEEVKGKPINAGIEKFKANPTKYTALMYQSDMLSWPQNQQNYILVHREGTKGYKPTGVNPKGWMTILLQEYERCPPFKDNEFPTQFRDKYTDKMSYEGKKLHSKKNKPIMPGRGMGIGDSPDLKIIGDVDPSDIYQGSVGDCWLLSGISSLAEFDGAVKKLFRKTKNLDKRPLDGPNQYIITLWDLPTWKEVDIVIDERLAAKADGSGTLLGAKPSEDAELWVCYLEKAFACHAGGWDKIKGGQCTHAWAVMTGCKEQYAICKNKQTGMYYCTAKFNPNTQQWNKQGNSPHDGDTGMYRCPWPAVGGGGDGEITQEELFMKMYAWDLENFIVGAGTSGTSDTNSTGGMVDNHAYSVIECRDNVAGTEIDLLKVRNPWGQGEIEDGEFDDDGPGWDKYPQIKAELNPVVADDGIFWLTKDEFFKFFQTIYLSASNMTEFLED